MLAQLEEQPEITEARVDWSGRKFLLQSSRGNVSSLALRILTDAGYDAKAVDAAPFVESYRAGEPWLRGGETLKLSTKEAEVLAGRWSREAGGRIGLTEEETARTESVLREELMERFRAVHEGGGIGARDRAGLHRAFGRTGDRCAAFLGESRSAELVEALRKIVGQ